MKMSFLVFEMVGNLAPQPGQLCALVLTGFAHSRQGFSAIEVPHWRAARPQKSDGRSFCKLLTI
jgi:hypothetical protein